MINIGRTDLVRAKPLRQKKPKSAKNTQQELGCSDDLTDSNSTDNFEFINKDKLVQSTDNNKSNTSYSELPQEPSKTSLSKSFNNIESVNYQSTGDHKETQTNIAEPEKPQSDKEKSKTIMNSIKSFFKL